MENMDLFRTIGQREEKQDDATVRVPSNVRGEISARRVIGEDTFMSMLYLERRRAERAQKRYVLLLVDVKDAISDKQKIRTVQTITQTLCEIMRETDLIGWYVKDHLIGVSRRRLAKPVPKKSGKGFRRSFEGPSYKPWARGKHLRSPSLSIFFRRSGKMETWMILRKMCSIPISP